MGAEYCFFDFGFFMSSSRGWSFFCFIQSSSHEPNKQARFAPINWMADGLFASPLSN